MATPCRWALLMACFVGLLATAMAIPTSRALSDDTDIVGDFASGPTTDAASGTVVGDNNGNGGGGGGGGNDGNDGEEGGEGKEDDSISSSSNSSSGLDGPGIAAIVIAVVSVVAIVVLIVLSMVCGRSAAYKRAAPDAIPLTSQFVTMGEFR